MKGVSSVSLPSRNVLNESSAPRCHFPAKNVECVDEQDGTVNVDLGAKFIKGCGGSVGSEAS